MFSQPWQFRLPFCCRIEGAHQGANRGMSISDGSLGMAAFSFECAGQKHGPFLWNVLVRKLSSPPILAKETKKHVFSPTIYKKHLFPGMQEALLMLEVSKCEPPEPPPHPNCFVLMTPIFRKTTPDPPHWPGEPFLATN